MNAKREGETAVGDFVYKSAGELAQLIRDGQATSTEVVQDHLEQLDKHNEVLNAVVVNLANEALEEAARCDEEASSGCFRGPLHGVPMTIKEQYWLKGTPSTVNFKMMKDWVAPTDAFVVDNLKRAGSVILGKTNVPKNLTDYQVSGDIYPEGKNPYGTEHSPGGSSGGAAAALASGMVPIELGGDFGGSIRNPSNYCGLFGIKPTEDTVPGFGSVPRAKGARGGVFHMAQPGPMARNPEDLELVWKVIRGPYGPDRSTSRIEWKGASDKSLRDYKVAWVDGWPGYEASGPTKALIAGFISQLEEHGCATENAAPAGDLHERSLSVFIRLFTQLISQDMPRLIRPLAKMQLKSGLLKGSDGFRSEFNGGFKDSFLYYSETMGLRARLVAEWESFFAQHDLLVCPMGFGPAFERCKTGAPISYDGKEMAYIYYAWPYLACFNASGHPAMNIPLGLGDDGLPVGVQVVGPYWSEPDLIQFAKLVSEFTEGFVRPESY